MILWIKTSILIQCFTFTGVMSSSISHQAVIMKWFLGNAAGS